MLRNAPSLCPECLKSGKRSVVKWMNFGLDEEIQICENTKCIFPFGDDIQKYIRANVYTNEALLGRSPEDTTVEDCSLSERIIDHYDSPIAVDLDFDVFLDAENDFTNKNLGGVSEFSDCLSLPKNVDSLDNSVDLSEVGPCSVSGDLPYEESSIKEDNSGSLENNSQPPISEQAAVSVSSFKSVLAKVKEKFDCMEKTRPPLVVKNRKRKVDTLTKTKGPTIYKFELTTPNDVDSNFQSKIVPNVLNKIENYGTIGKSVDPYVAYVTDPKGDNVFEIRSKSSDELEQILNYYRTGVWQPPSKGKLQCSGPTECPKKVYPTDYNAVRRRRCKRPPKLSSKEALRKFSDMSDVSMKLSGKTKAVSARRNKR